MPIILQQVQDMLRKAWNTIKKNRKTLLKIGKYAAFLVLAMVILVMGLFFYYTYDLPRPEKFTETPFIQSTKIYDRTGKVLLYDIYGEEKREIVDFDKISDNLKHAILASEDARFYHHGGIDLEAIIRSVLVDLKLQSPSEGASTITQQLIRFVYLNNQKTLQRKVREIVLSIELEKRYSKDQIFDWYLNQIPFGQNAYGAEAAAQTYFSTSAANLTIAQSALLTGLIKAPSYYSPYGSHRDQLMQKKDYILKQMRDQGYISQEQMDSAKSEVLKFSDRITPIKAPHFVMYIQQYLENKYGSDFLKEKGLKVYTTLDWDLQQHAEKVIQDADKSIKAYKANNAAAAVIDPKTGEILTLVGSKDYFAKSYPEGCDQKANGSCLFDPQFDVAIMGQRQPGSSFKPFVYATAFKQGYTPNTILWDVKTEFNTYCSPDGNQVEAANGLKCYNPQDYDGKYRGPIDIRHALDQSLNIPAVEALYLVGVKNSIQTAHDMGITTLNQPDRYGLGLVLGGGEVTLLDMTSAYGVFAAEGQRVPPVSILKIEDSSGNVIEQNNKQRAQVLDTQVARTMSDVLSDNSARAAIFGVNNPLHFANYQVAAKTGTTQFSNDAWTMGYTPFAAVGVWVGNNNNAPTTGESTTLAAPIWHKIMQKILETHPVENFTKPDPVEVKNPILAGQLPPDQPPHSILYYIDKDNPSNTSYPNPNKDPLFPFWEQAVQSWVQATQPVIQPPPVDPNIPIIIPPQIPGPPVI
ncbi:penicillin-binding protein [Candidatus Parcubacteria bacterium]|nr:penicillin-binding protein [Candidatus Parcubacteria bacterium]